MIDFEKLKHVFPFFNDLDATDVFDFLAHTKVLSLKAGDVFLKEGSMGSNIYFVKEGLIRSYFVNEKGEEITNLIRYENQIFASYENVLFHQASRFNFQAIEPTELFVIDFTNLRDMIDRNSKFETGRRFFVNTIMAESLNAIDDFILLNPEKRYLKFMKENPELLNRVPIKYIANVLGITPVSLSRIRKRVATKKQ
jgi:CRP-like cAMP-binding protein